MKHLIKKSCFVFALTFSIQTLPTVSAQALRNGVTTVQDVIDPGMVNPELLHGKPAEISGDPFLISDWVMGTVADIDGKKFENVLLRYQAFDDVLIIKLDNKEFVISKKLAKSFTFSVGSKAYFFEKVTLERDFKYLEPIYKQTLSFYKQYKKVVTAKGNTYNGGVKSSYTPAEAYFASDENKQVKEFKLNKKGVLALFPSYKGKIEAYLRKEKGKIKTEEDVKKVLKFIESILKK